MAGKWNRRDLNRRFKLTPVRSSLFDDMESDEDMEKVHREFEKPISLVHEGFETPVAGVHGGFETPVPEVHGGFETPVPGRHKMPTKGQEVYVPAENVNQFKTPSPGRHKMPTEGQEVYVPAENENQFKTPSPGRHKIPTKVVPGGRSKSPKKYIYRNPFLPQNDILNDDVRRTKTPFPGVLQQPVRICGFRSQKLFVKFMEILGEGDFAICHQVLHVLDGCYYALKISRLKYNLLEPNTDQVVRAQAEVQAMSYLGSHKHIVGYYGGWFEDGHLHIQLEFCEESLDDKNWRGGFTSEQDIQNVLYQLAKGLEYIHAKGVVHLDIKPANILIKDDVYKIGDFGMAGFADVPVGKSSFTTAGDGKYMPGNYDFGDPTKVDIFSLGISIYELVMRHHLGVPEFYHFTMPKGRDVQIDLNIPGYSRKFLELLQAMVDNDSDKRPSAADIVRNPVLEAVRKLNEMH